MLPVSVPPEAAYFSLSWVSGVVLCCVVLYCFVSSICTCIYIHMFQEVYTRLLYFSGSPSGENEFIHLHADGSV